MALFIPADQATSVQEFLASSEKEDFTTIKLKFIDAYAKALAETICDLIEDEGSSRLCIACSINACSHHNCMNGIGGYFNKHGSLILREVSDAYNCWEVFIDNLQATDVPRRSILNWMKKYQNPELYTEVIKQDLLNWINENFPAEKPVLCIWER